MERSGTILSMGSGILQPTHLIFLLLLALLLFGAKRLPEIGRSLGVGMREFKDSVSGLSGDSDTKVETRSELPPPAPMPVAAPPAQEVPVVVAAPVVAAEPASAGETVHETEPVS
jgi:sec-independent protein translocase protein TatA